MSCRQIFTALSIAAVEMTAVPCWSSCITGMSSSSLSRRSISKHSGALMSSRLMPPNVGAIAFTVRMNASGSGFVDFDVESVDVGESLEEHAFTFHDGLACQSSDIAQSQNGPCRSK